MARPVQTERQELIEQRVLWYLTSPSYTRHGIVSPSSIYFWLGHDGQTFNPSFPTQEEICTALNRLLEKGKIKIHSLFVDPKLRHDGGDRYEYGGITVLISIAEIKE